MKNLVKRILLTAAVFSFAAIFSSMSKNDGAEFRNAVVTGTIRFQGSIPFQYPCMETSDGKIYTIVADGKTDEKIRRNATSTFRITGRIIPNEPGKLSVNASKDGYLEVSEIKILKKK